MPVVYNTSFALTLPNYGKGGDFMDRDNSERQAAIREQMIRADLGTGIPTITLGERQVDPSKEKVEDGSNPSTHPMRRGGWLRPTLDELAQTIDGQGRPTIDWVVFRSAQEMDGRGS